MRHTAILCLLAALINGAGHAQDMGGYSAIRVDKIGSFESSFGDGFRFKDWTGGVQIALIPDDDGLDPLPIRAYTMRFTYAEGSDAPSRIEMSGNVRVNHPEGSLSSEKAVWDFTTGDLVFTGDPVMNSDMAENIRGSKITINLQESTLVIADMAADHIVIQDEAAPPPADPALLSKASVKDWPGFIDLLKAQAGSATPGGQVVAQLDAPVRDSLLNTSTEALARQQDTLVEHLNKVVRKPGLYSVQAWEGVSLDSGTQELLAKEALAPEEQSRLNRLLLAAAFPQHIAAE